VDADGLPLSHLRPCVFGENGVPAGNAAVSEYSDDETSMPLCHLRGSFGQIHTPIQSACWK
jgi:hypothetical protein